MSVLEKNSQPRMRILAGSLGKTYFSMLRWRPGTCLSIPELSRPQPQAELVTVLFRPLLCYLELTEGVEVTSLAAEAHGKHERERVAAQRRCRGCKSSMRQGTSDVFSRVRAA